MPASLNIIDPWFDVPGRAKVRIQADGIGSVTGIVPKSFTFDYSTEWTQPFASMLASFNTGLVAGQLLTNLGGQVDFSATIQELKSNVWKGGSTIKFRLDLLYIARRSAALDVVAPIKKLIQMSAGSTATRWTAEAADRRVSATVVKPPPYVHVEVGNVIKLKRAVLKGLSVNVTNVSDVNGMPVEALVGVDVESQKMFLADDTEVVVLNQETAVESTELTAENLKSKVMGLTGR